MSTNTITTHQKKILSTQNVINIGMLSAISFVLMYFDFPLPLFPEFLKIDLSDIPAVIGTFALGPIAGIFIELIKNLLYLVIKGTSSGGIGEVANFIVGISYIVPLGMVLKWSKNEKRSLYGVIIGLVSMLVVGAIGNYFFFIPAYSRFYGMPIESFVSMSNVVNPLVTDFKTMVLFAITPFNLIKGTVISIAGYYLYQMLKPAILRMKK
ncbi:ECF transporter S component [Vallitalea okinawensis]|uniref:ECF transporter S component n=1 Tax=Vallitalea okinawensis TaxID=2078660 RepID=UPI000CFD7265|nr:ECF transporter S component [Vallitalea okinawensis]